MAAASGEAAAAALLAQRAPVADEDIGDFLAKVEEVNAQIKLLRDGVTPDAVTTELEKEMAEKARKQAESAHRKQEAEDEERIQGLQQARRLNKEAKDAEMKKERLKWWRYALLRYGRVPTDRKSAFATEDASDLEEDLAALGGEEGTTDAEREAAATSKGYIGLNYSMWEAWTPDDPATRAEAEAAAAAKEKEADAAFEAANPAFCGQFLADMRSRRAKDSQKTEDSQRLRTKGNAAFKAGRLERALTLYYECLSLTPFSPAVLNNLAAVAKAGGNLPAAADFADRSLYVDDAQPKALFRRAGILTGQGLLHDAVVDLTRAAAEAPGSTQIRHALVDAQVALAESQDAAAASALLGGEAGGGDALEAPSPPALSTFALPRCPTSPAPGVAVLCKFLASPSVGDMGPAVPQACSMLATALRKGAFKPDEQALPPPLAWSDAPVPPAIAVATTPAILHALVRESGCLAAVCALLQAATAPHAPAGASAVVEGCCKLLTEALGAGLSAGIVREAQVVPKLGGWITGIAATANTVASSVWAQLGATADKGGAGGGTPGSAAAASVKHLRLLGEGGVTVLPTEGTPTASALAAAVSLVLAASRLARPHDTEAPADDRFLRQLIADGRQYLHTALPSLLMWAVAALVAVPPPQLLESGPPTPGLSAADASRAQEDALDLLNDVASAMQFLVLRSNTDCVPGGVSDGAAEAWAAMSPQRPASGGGTLSPVTCLLQSLASIVPRAVWDVDVLVHPAVQAATACLANMAHHPSLRPAFAARLPLAPAAAETASTAASMGLRPLLDMLRLPVPVSEPWTRVLGQALAAATNAATQCPEVAAAAGAADAVPLLLTALGGTFGVTGMDHGALPPLVCLRAAGLLSRLAVMDTSGGVVGTLRKGPHVKTVAACLASLVEGLVFSKGPAAPSSSADKATGASTMDALVLVVTAITTAKRGAGTPDAATLTSTAAALAVLVKCGGIGSVVAWLVHVVKEATAACQASLAPTVAALPRGGAAAPDPALVARLPVPPSSLRSRLAPRLRALGNIAKLLTNAAGAASAGSLPKSDVFEAALLAGGVEALTELVKAAPEGGPVRQNGAIALARLAKDPGCVARLRQCGGMSVLMSLHKEISPGK